MPNLIGEFECKIDAKGRVMLPAALKKQIPEISQDKYVVNRGFEKCLVLYPYAEWQKITNEINQLNLYVKKNRDFVRFFHRGATDLTLDGNNRFLIPKSLLEYANIDKDLVLFAFSNRIEIWSKEAYEKFLNDEPEDFSAIAEEVMGNKEKGVRDVDIS